MTPSTGKTVTLQGGDELGLSLAEQGDSVFGLDPKELGIETPPEQEQSDDDLFASLGLEKDDYEDDLSDVDTAEQWADTAINGKIYRLPGSGRRARIRKPNLYAQSVKAGYVPNPLSAEVVRFMAEVQPTANQYGGQIPESKQVEMFGKRAVAFIKIAELAFVSPKIVLTGQPNRANNEISISEITDRDLMYVVFEIVEGTADPEEDFRRRQARKNRKSSRTRKA